MGIGIMTIYPVTLPPEIDWLKIAVSDEGDVSILLQEDRVIEMMLDDLGRLNHTPIVGKHLTIATRFVENAFQDFMEKKDNA
jgi:hypothetical protein